MVVKLCLSNSSSPSSCVGEVGVCEGVGMCGRSEGVTCEAHKTVPINYTLTRGHTHLE